MRSRCQPGFLLFLVRSHIFHSCLDASFSIRFNYTLISTAQIVRVPTLPSSEPHFVHLLGCQDESAVDVKILPDVKINAKPSQNEKECKADVKIMRSRCQDNAKPMSRRKRMRSRCQDGCKAYAKIRRMKSMSKRIRS